MSDKSKQAGASKATRRDFIKGSAAAMVAGSLASGLTIGRSAHAAESGPLKIALIGCGGRGTGAANDCMEGNRDVKLVALADAFKDRLQGALGGLKGKYGDRVDVPESRQFVGFDAYKGAIECADVVLMATPPGFRPIHYEAAIKAGKHVFMEKPVATDAPGIRQVLAAAKEAMSKGLSTVCGLQRRHQLGYLESVKKIQDGEVGDILLMRAYWNGGPIWFNRRQEGANEMTYQMRNWYHFCWLSGDHICEQHVHNLDVCNWVKGDHPTYANGMGGRVAIKGYKGEIFDHHMVEFEYKDGSRLISECRQVNNTWGGVSEHVHGTKGSRGVGVGGGGLNPYVQEHIDLVKSIKEGKPRNEGEYGATSTMTAILGRMATYSGQRVSWDEALASNLNLQPEKYDFEANPKSMPDKDGFYQMPVPGVTKAY